MFILCVLLEKAGGCVVQLSMTEGGVTAFPIRPLDWRSFPAVIASFVVGRVFPESELEQSLELLG